MLAVRRSKSRCNCTANVLTNTAVKKTKQIVNDSFVFPISHTGAESQDRDTVLHSVVCPLHYKALVSSAEVVESRIHIGSVCADRHEHSSVLWSHDNWLLGAHI